ncbi:hypothetical protein B6U81_02565 [Thermoplasmatales archaeon ex4484_30]|nr:MAG: hypothetical protein B6U81_02565 [Thermoplasmatales archaeon ex4484_30]
MNKIAITAAILLLAFFAINEMNAEDSPSVVYVDDNFNESTPGWQIDHFNKIQDGLNGVEDNGTVYVYEGIYNENIVVDKTVELIGKNKPIVVGTIQIMANDSIIKNFELVGNLTNTGILLNATNCIIHGCTIYNFSYGMKILSNNNTITQCNFINNSYGINASGSENKIFLNNFIDNTINACNYGTNVWHGQEMQKGNYWSDFDEPSEGAYDNDSDGIVDAPYTILCGGGEDEYPLIHEIDLFPPHIMFVLNGSIGNDGWYVSIVNVTINASDNDTAYINYSIDGEWYKQNGSHINFYLAEDGIHVIACYAVDENGNAGKIEEVIVKVDNTPPMLNYILDPSSPDGKNGWYVSVVEIRASANDGNGSGIDELTVKINDGGWEDYKGSFFLENEGINEVWFKAVDVAGNEAEIFVQLKMDKTPPLISIEKPVGGFAKGDYEIEWNATDNVDKNLNGNISIFYSPDNGTSWYEVGENLSNSGTYLWNTTTFIDSKEAIIKVLAIDDAGNVGSALSMLFTLDNTPPAITVKAPKGGTFGKDEYGSIIIPVEWEANDAIDDDLEGNITLEYFDGLKWIKKQILINESSWTDSNIGDFDISGYNLEDGIYRITVVAIDDAGNVGSAFSKNFTIDTKPPQVSIVRPQKGYIYINIFGRDIIPSIPTIGAIYDVIIIGKITVKISASDESGIQEVQIKIDDNEPFSLNYPYDWEWDPLTGEHSLKVIVKDNARNMETIEMKRIFCINI